MTPPTIETLREIYKKMCDHIRGWDRTYNESTAKTYEQMTRIEKFLISQLRDTKDMQGLIAFYNDGRDELDALDDQYKKRKSHVMLRQEQLENVMFALLRETNVESMKTAAGTAFTSTQTSVKVADWRVFHGEIVRDAINHAFEVARPDEHGDEAFINAVIESEAWALLKRAASKDAVKAYVEENKKNVPGVDLTQWLQVGVRRK